MRLSGKHPQKKFFRTVGHFRLQIHDKLPVFLLFQNLPRNRHIIFHIPPALFSPRLHSIPPLDQRNGHILSAAGNLDTSYAAGMHTGAGIVIAGVGFEFFHDLICSFSIFQQHTFGQGQVFINRAVGVTGDDRVDSAIRKPGWVRKTGCGPGVIGFVDVVAHSWIVGGPGRVPESALLKERPNKSNKRCTESSPHAATKGICLVAMPHQNMVIQNRGLVCLNAGKNSLKGSATLFPAIVMIAPNFDVAGFFRIPVMKPGQAPIHRGMGDENLWKSLVFPQIFGISQFDQGETFGMIIVQGAIEDQGIGGKVVCAGAVAAVGVGEENESGFGCRGEPDGFYGLHDISIFDMVILPVPYGCPISEIRRRNENEPGC